MFSTVRENEFGSITKSKKEMGVLAGDARIALLNQTNKQTGGIHRANRCKHKLKRASTPFKS